MTTTELAGILSNRINKPAITTIARWASEAPGNFETLIGMSESTDKRTSVNALWCIAHIPPSGDIKLSRLQNYFIDRVLSDESLPKRRILMQLLRNMKYRKDALRSDFLDFCLSKINSQCEPYAIRSYCIYCSYEMCRHYPELLTELKQHLEMLSAQPLSPALKSALSNVRKLMSVHDEI